MTVLISGVSGQKVPSSASLVPMPFPPPVFDCLQYAKTKGIEGLGESHARHQIDVRGAVPDRCNSHTILCIGQSLIYQTSCFDAVF